MSREMRGHGNVYLRGSTWWVQFTCAAKSIVSRLTLPTARSRSGY